jgi:hypothetical protein
LAGTGSEDPQPAGSTEPKVWAIRAGSRAVYAGQFLSLGHAGIGFGVQMSVGGLGWDEITALAKEAMPGQPTVTIGLATGALYRVATEIREGDIVLTPEPNGTILAGVIVGPYEFRTPPIAEDFVHTRPVRWFARVQRNALSETARHSLGSLQSVFVPRAQAELLATLLPLMANRVPPPIAGPATVTAVKTILENPVQPSRSAGATISADTRDLDYLLARIKNGDLAVPAFQRSFVWDPSATRELLVSIASSFPAGNLLFLRGGEAIFSPRAVEGAPELRPQGAELLVLDGQQRLTSLYQALRGVGTHRYFLDIGALMKGTPVDDATHVYRTDRAKSWESIDRQAQDLMFPFERCYEFLTWKDDVIQRRQKDGVTSKEGIAVLSRYLNMVHERVISPVRNYKFPVTTLGSDTPTDAVLTIFETLNRTGLKLTVFELVTARVFMHFKLRDAWNEALTRHPILASDAFDVDPYYILQAIALRMKRVPQRGIVVALEVDALMEHWDEAVAGMDGALRMLRSECGVLTPRFLPYAPMLPTLAAAWAEVEAATGAQVGARKLKLQRWFWCASFAGEYDSSANSQAASDVPALRDWLTGGAEPPVVASFEFDPREWLRTTVRQRGLYRATMALMARSRPLDFHSVAPLTEETIKKEQVDDHHVFPSAYLQQTGDTDFADTVLNHTYIDHKTNITIGKRSPSDYLGDVESHLGADLPRVLASHTLPPEKDGALWRNDYKGFLEWRLLRLAAELEAVTAGGVQATVGVPVSELIGQGEGQQIEFKATARYNGHTGGRDAVLEKEVALTVAAYMNATGGTLLIGVSDGGIPLGLADDYKIIRGADDDAFQRVLLDLIQTYLGKPALAYVDIELERTGDVNVARVNARPSPSKVYLKPPGQDADEFYVRFGNTSRKLTHQEADQYARDRWPVS